MFLPIEWVKSFVDFDEPVDQIGERLTLAGIEIESDVAYGVLSPEVVVCEVREVSPLEGKDDVVSVIVGIGDAEVHVVSAAPNVRNLDSGAKLALARPGAAIFDGYVEGVAVTSVRSGVVYGQASDGVLCSPKELGLSDDHAGVLVLDAGATPGTPVAGYVDSGDAAYADRVLELAILPNIARCQSVRGCAREIAALVGGQARIDADLPALESFGEATPPDISSTSLCKRFSVAKVEGVAVCASPLWLQRRLVMSGVEPINNLVDATNYVMLEYGQPMHAYDATRLPSEALAVRKAREGESLHTLTQSDEEDAAALPEGTLLITSADQPVAVAGIVGGSETAIADETDTVLLECANFDFLTVRRSQVALKVFTEAASRFSRGVDAETTWVGIQRWISIVRETCPDLVVLGAADSRIGPPESLEISLSLEEIAATLGLSLPGDEVLELLRRVGLDASLADGTISVAVPSFRNDLALPCDVVEEVGRLYGYDRLPTTMPEEAIPTHPRNRHREAREALRDFMVRQHLQEMVSYSFTHPGADALLHAGRQSAPEFSYVTLQNPIGPERSVVRRNLLPGLLQTLAKNLRHTPDVQAFELGFVAHPEDARSGAGLPYETEQLAFVLTGPRHAASLHSRKPDAVDFFDAKGIVQGLLAYLHVEGARFEAANEAPFQPGVCARVSVGGLRLGTVGALHPEVAARFDLEGAHVFVGDFAVDALLSVARPDFLSEDLPRFPSVDLDISLLIAAEIPVDHVFDVIHDAGGSLLYGASIFDVYEGTGVPEGQKALAFRIWVNAGDRTLTMEEAMTVRKAITTEMVSKLNATIRE